jgi:hypothetical protein
LVDEPAISATPRNNSYVFLATVHEADADSAPRFSMAQSSKMGYTSGLGHH